MKNIDELRKGFEETETAKMFLSWTIDYDEENGYYYTSSEYKRDVDSLNAAFQMFRELNK